MLMLERAERAGSPNPLAKFFLGLVSKLGGPKPDIISGKDLFILKGGKDQLVPWSANRGFNEQAALLRDKAEVVWLYRG